MPNKELVDLPQKGTKGAKRLSRKLLRSQGSRDTCSDGIFVPFVPFCGKCLIVVLAIKLLLIGQNQR
jgi:hypothetical protein